MIKLCLEFSTLARVLVLGDNQITACKSYEFTEDILDRIFRDVFPLKPDALFVSLKLIYTEKPEGFFVVDKINNYEGKSMFGVLHIDNLISLQYFAKNLGLKQFILVSNTAIYSYLLEGKTATVLDEYGKGLYIVAPYAGVLQDYCITTDIMLEEIAKIYPLKIKSQAFVNLLYTDIGSLAFSAHFKNYDTLPEETQKCMAGLLAISLVPDGIPIQVNDDLISKSVLPVDLAEKKKSKKDVVQEKEMVEAQKPPRKKGAVRAVSCLLIVSLVLVCLSSVINYKVPEDIALLNQVNVNMAETQTTLEERKVYLNYAIAERAGSAPSYNYIYTLASHLEIDGIVTGIKCRPTYYEVSFLVKSMAEVDVIREKLGALIEIEDGVTETLTKDGVSLYHVSFVHKLS